MNVPTYADALKNLLTFVQHVATNELTPPSVKEQAGEVLTDFLLAGLMAAAEKGMKKDD